MIPHLKPIFAASALVLSAAPAGAAVIPGLYNTGTDANNVALVGGNGVIDPHYTISSAPSAPEYTGLQAVTYNYPYPLAEDADSRWISLNSAGGPGGDQAIYRLSFDLTGFDHTTATISGSFAADNFAIILLNRVVIANSGTTGGFTAFTDFTLDSRFFVGGLNTLEFLVSDGGAPSALRVDNLRGTANLLAVGPGAVPEPGTWAMMILGFGLVGGAMRRRRTNLVPAPA